MPKAFMLTNKRYMQPTAGDSMGKALPFPLHHPLNTVTMPHPAFSAAAAQAWFFSRLYESFLPPHSVTASPPAAHSTGKVATKRKSAFSALQSPPAASISNTVNSDPDYVPQYNAMAAKRRAIDRPSSTGSATSGTPCSSGSASPGSTAYIPEFSEAFVKSLPSYAASASANSITPPHSLQCSSAYSAPHTPPADNDSDEMPLDLSATSSALKQSCSASCASSCISSRASSPIAPSSPGEIAGGAYPCRECGKCYSTSSNLARHRQIHRSVTDKKARACPQCGKVYVSMPAYSMHVRTHKNGCACPFCGKRFSRPWLLQGHIRTHTGEKPFECDQCSKAFADKSNLRAHVQTHSMDKPFICGRCGKAFALKSYLYKHEESSCYRGGRPGNNRASSSERLDGENGV